MTENHRDDGDTHVIDVADAERLARLEASDEQQNRIIELHSQVNEVGFGIRRDSALTDAADLRMARINTERLLSVLVRLGIAVVVGVFGIIGLMMIYMLFLNGPALIGVIGK